MFYPILAILREEKKRETYILKTKLDEVSIEDMKVNLKLRDDMPTTLIQK